MPLLGYGMDRFNTFFIPKISGSPYCYLSLFYLLYPFLTSVDFGLIRIILFVMHFVTICISTEWMQVDIFIFDTVL